MAFTDAFNNIFAVNCVPPQSAAAGKSGPTAGVDTAGFESVTFIMNYGVIGATAEWSHQILESDGATGVYAVVKNTDTIISVLGVSGATGTQVGPTGTQDGSVWRMGYVGNKRFVKLKMLNAKNSVSLFSGVCSLGTPHSAPTDVNP